MPVTGDVTDPCQGRARAWSVERGWHGWRRIVPACQSVPACSRDKGVRAWWPQAWQRPVPIAEKMINLDCVGLSWIYGVFNLDFHLDYRGFELDRGWMSEWSLVASAATDGTGGGELWRRARPCRRANSAAIIPNRRKTRNCQRSFFIVAGRLDIP